MVLVRRVERGWELYAGIREGGVRGLMEFQDGKREGSSVEREMKHKEAIEIE